MNKFLHESLSSQASEVKGFELFGVTSSALLDNIILQFLRFPLMAVA